MKAIMNIVQFAYIAPNERHVKMQMTFQVWNVDGNHNKVTIQ